MNKRENPLFGTEVTARASKYSKEPWRLVECQRSGLVYMENPPEYEALEEEFAWERTFESERSRRIQEEPVVARLSTAAQRLRSIVRRYRKIVTLPADCLVSLGPRAEKDQEVVLLDIGSGNGEHTVKVVRHLEASLGRSVRPVAVEISRAQAEVANERLADFNGGRCVQAAALEGLQQLAGVRADLILLSSFLEHEVQPVELLSACRACLKPEGIVIIKVPNFASWNRYIRQKKWCGFRYPDHVNYFTPATLRLAIETAGLHVARMKLWDRFPLSDNMYAVAQRA